MCLWCSSRSVCLCLFYSYKRTHQVGLSIFPTPLWSHLNCCGCSKTLHQGIILKFLYKVSRANQSRLMRKSPTFTTHLELAVHWPSAHTSWRHEVIWFPSLQNQLALGFSTHFILNFNLIYLCISILPACITV